MGRATAMTSGGYSRAEAWNLQLQGRVRSLETALRDLLDDKGTTYAVRAQRARKALASLSEADIASVLGNEQGGQAATLREPSSVSHK